MHGMSPLTSKSVVRFRLHDPPDLVGMSWCGKTLQYDLRLGSGCPWEARFHPYPRGQRGCMPTEDVDRPVIAGTHLQLGSLDVARDMGTDRSVFPASHALAQLRDFISLY